MATPTVASAADLMAAVPVLLLLKSGELRLADGRLTFTTAAGDAMLAAPVHELHSVARALTGIHIWHGDKRWRFAFGKPTPDNKQAAKDLAESWVAVLTPLVGQPPVGVRPRRPWPMWAWVVGLTGTIVAILAVASAAATALQ